MTTVRELKRWLDTLNPESSVGIDEGGLTLHEITPDGKLTNAYWELGGIPEEDEEGEDE